LPFSETKAAPGRLFSCCAQSDLALIARAHEFPKIRVDDGHRLRAAIPGFRLLISIKARAPPMLKLMNNLGR
jgi:hypothetical protein